jgi:hypothetical protein
VIRPTKVYNDVDFTGVLYFYHILNFEFCQSLFMTINKIIGKMQNTVVIVEKILYNNKNLKL